MTTMRTANTSLSSFAAALLLSSLFLSSASAFDITLILQKYPNFSQLNALLSSTQVAGEINSRPSITLLAVDNNGIGDVASKPADVQKRIIQTHVVLDYYDEKKLTLINNDTVLTTLFQTTGAARDQQGQIQVSRDPNGPVMFGSATGGSPIDAKYLGAVTSQPYNISVLHISHAIIPNGIDSNSAPPAPPKALAPVPGQQVPSPSPVPRQKAPSPAPVPGQKAPAPVPVPSQKAPAPAPALHASSAASPEESPAAAPGAGAPVAADAPAPSPADGPNVEAPNGDDSPAAGSSGAVKQVVSAVALASLLVALL